MSSTTPASTNLPTPAIALAIAAHPDDVEFQAGATLAKWAAAGCAIHHLILTDGSKGSWDPTEDQATLVATREAEQRRAAARLGGGPDGVRFLPATAVIIVAGPISGRLADRVGPRPLMVSGLLIVAFSLLWQSRVEVDTSYGYLVGAFVLITSGSERGVQLREDVQGNVEESVQQLEDLIRENTR